MRFISVSFLLALLVQSTTALAVASGKPHHARHQNTTLEEPQALEDDIEGTIPISIPEVKNLTHRVTPILDSPWDMEVIDEKSPDLDLVAAVAIIGFGAVMILDAVGHVADSYIEDEHERTRVDHMVDGAAAFLGFLIAAIWYGLLQEYILTQEYTTGKFPSAAFLVLANKLMVIPMAVILMVYTDELRFNYSASSAASIPGLMTGVASLCDQCSLRFITYPVQSIFKSSSLMPTMAVNSMVNGESPTYKEYAAAVFITCNVAGFSLSNMTDKTMDSKDMPVGLLLMSIYLVTLAVMAALQKKVFNDHHDFTHNQMLFVTSIWGSAFSLVCVCCTTGVAPLVEFVFANPACVPDILALAFSGALGLYFIFYIIKHHGPVALTIMGVVKTIVSVVFSSWLYGHPLNKQSKCCACGVVVGVLAATYFAQQRRAKQATLEKKVGHLRSMLRVSSSFNRSFKSVLSGRGSFLDDTDDDTSLKSSHPSRSNLQPRGRDNKSRLGDWRSTKW